MNFYTDISQKPGAGDCVSPKQNRDCFEKAVKGSEDALQEFIVTNMRLVSSAIEHFIARHSASAYLTDDMFSEGLLALTRSTKTLVKQLSADEEALKIGLNSFLQKTRQKENPNVIMYIYISIYRAIQEIYEIDSSDCISKRMRKHYTPSGQTTPTKQVDIPEICFDQLMCDPFAEIFLLESVFDVCKTDQERLIVEKRLAGYMDREIAEELDFHRASVATIRNRLYKRFRMAKGLPRET
jgi:DNA-binding NarL/FixJ family response regulator